MPTRQTIGQELCRTVPETVDVRPAPREALDLESRALHELDYEDLALSVQALRLVRRSALAVLRRFQAVDEGELPLARALALFLDRVLWDEDSGGLILCAEFPGQRFCLPIPRGLWGLRNRLGPAQ